MCRLCLVVAAHAHQLSSGVANCVRICGAINLCAAAPQIEKAGGYSSADGKCISGLDVPIEAYDQRTQICYGSLAEVRGIPCVAAVRGCCRSWMVSLAAAPCRV